jgi:hypothetical protein
MKKLAASLIEQEEYKTKLSSTQEDLFRGKQKTIA